MSHLRAAYGALGIGYRAWRWSYRNRLRRLREGSR